MHSGKRILVPAIGVVFLAAFVRSDETNQARTLLPAGLWER